MTGPIYLVRHAKAGHRERWTDDDELRPLTKKGVQQAEALVELFRDQPFTRLISPESRLLAFLYRARSPGESRPEK